MKKIMVVLLFFGMSGCHRSIRRQSIQNEQEISSLKRVCFSPNPECTQSLIAFIRSATKSLDIAIFQITEPQIVEEILLASHRLPVRVVVDQRQSKDIHSLVSTLRREGVNLRFGRQKGIMHHKFIIVDEEKLETGSFNFTRAAGEKNQENQIYSSDPAYVQPFVTHFKKMWDESHAP